jgi:hypothetical protein
MVAESIEDVIRLCLETAAAYRLSDPFDRETVRRFMLRSLKRLKAEGEISAEEASKVLQQTDLGTFRDFENEQFTGLTEGTEDAFQ